ncbi:PQQ-dependent sugar dehydrogenase [Alkanindiges illinoisensis]|uniref:PQQ-dependent sugar dehydrogenase n=1 Tax=Alkanindiges illinoisensis TaxID=197183 RepID=A0A4Y7X9K3_9GAMM|nr:PQQ-dependent sugar dehydrogenase [Alkanindiges illinoisensis]
MFKRTTLTLLMAGLMASLVACNNSSNSTAAEAAPVVDSKTSFSSRKVTQFNEPWAMTFLPDGRLLVTEKKGQLKLYDTKTGKTGSITGIPQVAYGGQGGLGDIVLHPDFAKNGLVYLSYAESGTGGKGAVVARGKLTLNNTGGGQLSQLQVIWRQVPKVSGDGHFGHRIAFDQSGLLWISSGERQKFDPAQDMRTNLGKIIRLKDDGSIPADNPFASQGGVAAQVWSLGHRNPLGLAFNAKGELWEIEMGPKGGDELNLIEKARNYGYPLVSNGDHYDGTPIPNHDTRPEFKAPAVSWSPVISPSSLMFYSGNQFPAWKNSAFVGGLSSEALIRIEFNGNIAREAERFEMGARIREVEQGPDGSIWLLEDGPNASLLQLQPKT